MPKQTLARKRYKKKYYKKHQIYNSNGYNRYSDYACKMILKHEMTDVELAKLLNRSLMSIQVKRVRLNK